MGALDVQMTKGARSGDDALRAYLPAPLLRHYSSRDRREPIWSETLTGSLMHCDITGFTAMSERLARLGNEGAELMAGVLNRFFERMLAIAEQWGGEQMKFGGDAVLLFFPAAEHASRAAACGLEMQSAMREFRRVQAGGQLHELRMRIGVHSGDFFSASVGEPEELLHYMLLGPDVSRAATVEALARPGQVVFSREAAAELPPAWRTTPAAAGLLRVSKTPPDVTPDHAHSDPTPVIPLVYRYVLPPIAQSLIERGSADLGGEHRRITAMFINLLGMAELLEQGHADALAQLDAYARMLVAALARHGGSIAGSDVAEDGEKFIILFGAPVSREGAEASALRCALEMQENLRASGLALRHRIGIGSGFAFAGEIGSDVRREYTVIGDTVNLSARLMSSARAGEVVVSARTVERAGEGFALHRLRPLRVKGKSAPVHAFRLQGYGESPAVAGVDRGAMVGRDSELSALLRLARRVEAGRVAWAYITGEPGIGKTRIVTELTGRLESKGWRCLWGRCYAHTSHVPFSAWIDPLRQLLGVTAAMDGARAWDTARDEVARLAPAAADFAALIGELLMVDVPEEEEMGSLDGNLRRQRLLSTIVEVFRGAALERPLVFAVDSLHWADASSIELLSSLAQTEDARLLVCVISRLEAPPPEMAEEKPQLSVRLSALSDAAARRMLAIGEEMSASRVASILGRAQGNPLFLQEIARTGAPAGADVPETVNEVVMARLDALPAAERLVVRTASVIGPSFEAPALRALLGERIEEARMRQALGALTELGFTEEDETQPPAFAFHHVLTQEVAYESLPYAERRRLHRAVAAYLERERAGQLESVCELLLHHFERADDAQKSSIYAMMSGDHAAALFASREALEFYQRSLAAAERSAGRAEGARSVLLERIGDCLETTGKHSEAVQAYEGALGAWEGPRRRHRGLPWPRHERVHKAVLYRKLGVSCERGSSYDASLRWLDEALRVLPRRPVALGAQVCAAKSTALFRKGLFRDGVIWGRRAVELAARSGDRREMAYARNMLANSYMEQGDLRKALRQQRQSVRLYHELRDFPGQASANNNLGKCYQLLGMFDAALYHYEVGLQADERVGDAVDVAVAHNNIGEVLLALGRIAEAVGHFGQVMAAVERHPDLAALVGLAQVNLCRCWMAEGDLARASTHLRRSLRLLRRVGAEGILVEALMQKSALHLAEGRSEDALREARGALAKAETLEARLLQARGEKLVGEALAALGRHDQALGRLRSSVSLARQMGAEHEGAQAQLAMGRVLLSAGGSSGVARMALRKAVSALSRMGAERDLSEAQRLLSEAQ